MAIEDLHESAKHIAKFIKKHYELKKDTTDKKEIT